ncbi:class A beta-lactamase [Streptomyces sp. B1866]|uniref:class A beta-lactamase n=1 Tax=Streptomyces sp. B1866 TaxID=3075431 RepID=UPI00288D6481|nr:class A beta-lactamase [Streptomyces sp. B1866]MDT3398881.1 class A beta-lactamase [Streptomyces sp. B1866]
MEPTATARMSRRALLACGAGAAVAAAGPGTAAYASAPGGAAVVRRLRDLERAHGARLGVYALDTATGRSVAYRASELFPMCSVFKTVAVAAVLRDLDRNGEFLARRFFYTAQDVERAGGGAITSRPENLANGLTAEELCEAAIRHSDNAAANLLLRELGGPTSVTRFCRSVGDRVTRLDRWEPELNSAEPWRVTDTTTPRAIAGTYARLVLGGALEPADRERLTGWLRGNTTGGRRLRAGLPAGWTVGDKTGTGAHGTTNDAAVAWPPGRGPIVMAVLTTYREPDAPMNEPLLAETAAALAAALG